jgi:hypothetical protein
METTLPVISRDMRDATVPGAVIETDADSAEALGAFEETALDENAAWEANGDLNGV